MQQTRNSHALVCNSAGAWCAYECHTRGPLTLVTVLSHSLTQARGCGSASVSTTGQGCRAHRAGTCRAKGRPSFPCIPSSPLQHCKQAGELGSWIRLTVAAAQHACICCCIQHTHVACMSQYLRVVKGNVSVCCCCRLVLHVIETVVIPTLVLLRACLYDRPSMMFCRW
jgi:hypothetical protein